MAGHAPLPTEPKGAQRVSMRILSPRLPVAALGAALLLASCAAQQTASGVEAEAPGFFLGVWHGFIFPVAWIISLFVDSVAIYAVPNNGGWYDFGYFVGIVFLGVGARSSKKVVVYRSRR